MEEYKWRLHGKHMEEYDQGIEDLRVKWSKWVPCEADSAFKYRALINAILSEHMKFYVNLPPKKTVEIEALSMMYHFGDSGDRQFVEHAYNATPTWKQQ